MRYFILSDAHSNLEALTAVLLDMAGQQPRFSFGIGEVLSPYVSPEVVDGIAQIAVEGDHDRVVFLGDATGYGASPNEVMYIISQIADIWLRGNHEAFTYQLHKSQEVGTDELYRDLPLDEVNWLRLAEVVTTGHKLWRENDILFSHASPGFTACSEYVDSVLDARNGFFDVEGIKERFCFMGHVHVPQIYVGSNGGVGSIPPVCLAGLCNLDDAMSWEGVGAFEGLAELRYHALRQFEQEGTLGMQIDLSKFDRALVVVPSIGQPRGRFKHSGYVIFDPVSRLLTIRKVPYDLESAQQRVIAAQLNRGDIQRLS